MERTRFPLRLHALLSYSTSLPFFSSVLVPDPVDQLEEDDDDDDIYLWGLQEKDYQYIEEDSTDDDEDEITQDSLFSFPPLSSPLPNSLSLTLSSRCLGASVNSESFRSLVTVPVVYGCSGCPPSQVDVLFPTGFPVLATVSPPFFHTFLSFNLSLSLSEFHFPWDLFPVNATEYDVAIHHSVPLATCSVGDESQSLEFHTEGDFKNLFVITSADDYRGRMAIYKGICKSWSQYQRFHVPDTYLFVLTFMLHQIFKYIPEQLHEKSLSHWDPGIHLHIHLRVKVIEDDLSYASAGAVLNLFPSTLFFFSLDNSSFSRVNRGDDGWNIVKCAPIIVLKIFYGMIMLLKVFFKLDCLSWNLISMWDSA